ncbi:MAG: hypothetical protein ACUVV6_04390 [Thermoplasmatota archaeon]
MLILRGRELESIAFAASIGLFLWKKKRDAAPAGAPPSPQAPAPPPGFARTTGPTPPVPAAPVQPPAAPTARSAPPEKVREWAEYERLYGRPHPEAGGWINPAAGGYPGFRPKCPVDGFNVTFEPFSGQYFCSRCSKRYTREEVAPKGPSHEYEYFAAPERSEALPAEEAPQPSQEPAEASAPQPLWLSAGETPVAGEAEGPTFEGRPPSDAAPPPAGEPGPGNAPPAAESVMEAEPVPEEAPLESAEQAQAPAGPSAGEAPPPKTEKPPESG